MKKVRNVLFACMLLSGALFIYSACNNGGGEPHPCGNPIDANCDGICDSCKDPMTDAEMSTAPCPPEETNPQ